MANRIESYYQKLIIDKNRKLSLFWPKLARKKFWRLELHPEDKEEARDLREHSLFLAGFSLVSFGILMSFDLAQIKVLLHPIVGLRIPQYLFICLILFATCSEVSRRIKYYYEYVLADIFYMSGIMLLYFLLSTTVFQMKPSFFIKTILVLLLASLNL